jgi:BirA family biotin operon repressor/biotin-[acetyl-CoA-carboxylase] ligase
VALELARAGAEHGTAVIAEAQTAGRGRLGRSFFSPPYQNLYTSIVLRPSVSLADAPTLILTAGVAVAEAVAATLEKDDAVELKWPNDVLVGGLKTSGILMELGAEGSRVAFLVLGIGVNLNVDRNAFPEEFRALATSLRSFRGASVDRLAFVRRMYHGLEALLDAHATGGFEAVRPRFERRFAMAGRPVRVRDATRPEAPDAETAGVVEGIGADGALLLRREDGTRARVVAGDVTIVKPPRGSALRDGGGGSA